MQGPADLVFTELEQCENNPNVIKFDITQKRHNRTTQLLDFVIDSPFEINDNNFLELKGSMYKEGGYKPGSFYMKSTLCDTLKTCFGDLFYQVLKKSGVAEDCPIPAGPADLVFTELEQCENNPNVIKFDITQKRHNRTTQLLDFVIDSPFEINDNNFLELKGSMYKEGGYKPGSFYMKSTLCDTLKTCFGDLFYQVLKKSGVAEDCPIPAGSYTALDYFLDNSQFTVPQMYGKNKMEARILNENEELQSCFVAYYEFVPKADS